MRAPYSRLSNVWCIKFRSKHSTVLLLCLEPPYIHSCSKKYRKVFIHEMAIFRRAGGLLLLLVFQYLILMIWRACDSNLVMISFLASKWQDFKLRGLQFHFIKQPKNGHSNFKDLLFWNQWRYYDQIWIASSSYHKNRTWNQILKS